jgi:hypothetical protein
VVWMGNNPDAALRIWKRLSFRGRLLTQELCADLEAATAARLTELAQDGEDYYRLGAPLYLPSCNEWQRVLSHES